MQRFLRILKFTAIIILVIGIAAGSVALFANYSDGSRAGTIIKFSRKGYVFKTYEGQLNLDALSEKGIWEFSVFRSDEGIQQEIDDALSRGYKVKLHYKEKLFQFDWRGKTKYFVYEVERVEEDE